MAEVSASALSYRELRRYRRETAKRAVGGLEPKPIVKGSAIYDAIEDLLKNAHLPEGERAELLAMAPELFADVKSVAEYPEKKVEKADEIGPKGLHKLLVEFEREIFTKDSKTSFHRIPYTGLFYLSSFLEKKPETFYWIKYLEDVTYRSEKPIIYFCRRLSSALSVLILAKNYIFEKQAFQKRNDGEEDDPFSEYFDQVIVSGFEMLKEFFPQKENAPLYDLIEKTFNNVLPKKDRDINFKHLLSFLRETPTPLLDIYLEIYEHRSMGEKLAILQYEKLDRAMPTAVKAEKESDLLTELGLEILRELFPAFHEQVTSEAARILSVDFDKHTKGFARDMQKKDDVMANAMALSKRVGPNLWLLMQTKIEERIDFIVKNKQEIPELAQMGDDDIREEFERIIKLVLDDSLENEFNKGSSRFIITETRKILNEQSEKKLEIDDETAIELIVQHKNDRPELAKMTGDDIRKEFRRRLKTEPKALRQIIFYMLLPFKRMMSPEQLNHRIENPGDFITKYLETYFPDPKAEDEGVVEIVDRIEQVDQRFMAASCTYAKEATELHPDDADRLIRAAKTLRYALAVADNLINP